MYESDDRVLVLIEGRGGNVGLTDRQLIGAGRELAILRRAPLLAVAWPGIDPADLFDAGADIVAPIDVAPGLCERESIVTGMLHLRLSGQFLHYLFPDNCGRAGDAGRQLAAALGGSPLTGIIAFQKDVAVRKINDGYHAARLSKCLFCYPGGFAPAQHAGLGLCLDPVSVPPGSTTVLGRMDSDKRMIPLSEAAFIVAAGNGVSDWDSFQNLALILGATIGATRAVCDAGLLPRDRQIGASGEIVSPRAYLALGISGAPQHVQGLRSCDHVIAVNTDFHAEMVQRANLGVIANVQDVMPALIDKLQARRQ